MTKEQPMFKSAAAQALGRRAAGHKKTLTPEERERRRQSLAAARAARWPETKEAPATPATPPGADLTPIQTKYRQLKGQLPPGSLLAVRLGDFYELFFSDAEEAAAILKIALMKRHTVPMCGFPFHAAKHYIEQLLAAGRKVAIVDDLDKFEVIS